MEKIFNAVLAFILLILEVFSGGGGTTDDNLISFSKYSTNFPAVNVTVTFTHTVKNAKGKYQKTYVYENSKVLNDKTSKCQMIESDDYTEKDQLKATKKGTTKYLEVVLYSDSSCEKEIKSAKSNQLKWGDVAPDGGTTTKAIEQMGTINWKQGNNTCESIGITGVDTASLVACIAWGNVGGSSSSGQCATYVKQVLQWAGVKEEGSIYAFGNITESPKNGDIITFTSSKCKNSQCHIAIYTSMGTVNGGMSNDTVQLLTLDDIKKSVASFHKIDVDTISVEYHRPY